MATQMILLVEDDPSARAELSRLLRAHGYAVIPARRGVEAHWCVERHGHEIDLIIADFAGPEADDYHLGISIGALLPHTPILFVSVHPREESIRRGLIHPRTPFLRKPFPPTALPRKVREVLDGWPVRPAV